MCANLVCYSCLSPHLNRRPRHLHMMMVLMMMGHTGKCVNPLSLESRDGIEPSLYGFGFYDYQGSVRVLVKFVNVRF